MITETCITILGAAYLQPAHCNADGWFAAVLAARRGGADDFHYVDRSVKLGFGVLQRRRQGSFSRIKLLFLSNAFNSTIF